MSQVELQSDCRDRHELLSNEHVMGRLDQMVAQLHDICVTLEHLRTSAKGVTQVTEDHEMRVRHLEAWTHRMGPWFGIATFVAGAFATALLETLLR